MYDDRPLVIQLSEAEWDLSARDTLQFLLAPATNRPRVFIDMSAVTFIDATCLGKLAVLQRERSCKFGLQPAVFVVAYRQVRRLFRLVGFDKLWPVFGTLREALANDSHDDLTRRAAI